VPKLPPLSILAKKTSDLANNSPDRKIIGKKTLANQMLFVKVATMKNTDNFHYERKPSHADYKIETFPCQQR